MKADEKKYTFKNMKYSYLNGGGKKFIWRSLKQITATDKTLPWAAKEINYTSLTAPPSFIPTRKYSDISGLIAPYKDPYSKLYFHNSEEFIVVKSMPSDLTAGYLSLRGANSVIG